MLSSTGDYDTQAELKTTDLFVSYRNVQMNMFCPLEDISGFKCLLHSQDLSDPWVLNINNYFV